MVPTLTLQGRPDRARPPEHGAEMDDRVSGAQLEIIDKAGRIPQLEDPSPSEIALPFLTARP